MGNAGKCMFGPGVFDTARSVPVIPSRIVETYLFLYTHMTSGLLQTETVYVEAFGFHFEYSTLCSEIQTLLLLWETVQYVELSCNTWATLWNCTGSKMQGYDSYGVFFFLVLC